MDFTLSPELAELQHRVRQVARDVVAPRAPEIDRTGEYPTDLLETFRDQHLLGLALPVAYGGSGEGILGLTLAVEEIAKYSSVAALLLLLARLPAGPLLAAGSEEQRHTYLPGLATGRTRAALALSEPQAGTDALGISTRATPDRESDGRGGWVLEGTKCWVSGVQEADWYVVFAKTGDPGDRSHRSVTAFIVERDAHGVEVGPLDSKMGVHGVDTGVLRLRGVRVSANHVVGEVGGFRQAMLGLAGMRPVVAARGLGLAEGALMYATRYVQQRAAFEQTIADFQGVRWEIAKCAADIEGARLLTYRAALLAEEGKFTKQWAPLLSVAKYQATELAVRASGLALQLLGAAGYMGGHPTEQWYRDAKQLTIVEGTSQVQLNLISRGVLDRDLWWD
jgi:hypothetical protein